MLEENVNITFITSKNCFCYLSEKQRRYVKEGTILKLNCSTGNKYLSVGGLLPSLHRNSLGVCPAFAKALNLCEGDTVSVTAVQSLPLITTLTVTPVHENDYEVLQLLTSELEESLLRQIRVVYKSQEFVIWISNFSTVTVKVDGAEPENIGVLDFLTEIHVNFSSEPPQLKHDMNKNRTNMITNSEDNLFDQVFNLMPIDDDFQNFLKQEKYSLFPFDAIAYVGVDRKLSASAETFCRLEIVNVPNLVEISKELYINVRVMNSKHFKTKSFFGACLYIDKLIFEFFNVPNFSRAIIRPAEDHEHDNTNSVKICTSMQNVSHALKEFKEFVEKCCLERKLLLMLEIPFRINAESIYSVHCNDKYLLFETNVLQKCKFTAEYSDKLLTFAKECEKKPNTRFCNIGHISNDVIATIRLIFQNAISCENILVIGKRGAGKTTLAKIIEQEVLKFNVHTEIINCKTIKGKLPDSISRLFSELLSKLVYFQPSLLIVDDINIICDEVVEGDQPTQESLYFNRIAETLSEMLDNEIKRNKIIVLATSDSLNLNHKLYSSKGKHSFKNVYHISELNKDERGKLLEHLFSEKTQLPLKVDLDQFAMKTEGFVVQDVVDFVNRSVFESYKEESSFISNAHCEKAFDSVLTICLQNIQLHTPGSKDFSDIGGLNDVKTILVESLLWPLQYPLLFENSPLRLQSGLLLYGLPGTGKTALAGAAAKQCGLRLISVKGPELLSKYIGASEQAVRKVFEKAQRAKPCILFFDEFDSLAPRRGHDNTGVTDRVVNQFLTQLDGIEALNGVCVIAATSRPDLLDPALLRPGRLDRQILCPLPDLEARYDILKVLSKSLNLDQDVDFHNIAANTKGYTGADLQSLLYTARLSSFDSLLEESKCDRAITSDDLEQALKTTRPSLTRQEREKYETIYASFQHGVDIKALRNMKQRATLA